MTASNTTGSPKQPVPMADTIRGDDREVSGGRATAADTAVITAHDADAPRPLPPLFNLPFEIRLQIFYWALRAYAYSLGDRVSYGDFGKGEIRMVPGYPPSYGDDDDSWGWTRSFGSPVMSGIFPVCRQWYDEIQVALYTMFSFQLDELIARERKPCALSFLPQQALSLLVHLNFRNLPPLGRDPSTKQTGGFNPKI
jgi:hypothetical protein